MEVCLSHSTALHWLLRNFSLRSRGDRPSRAFALPQSASDVRAAEDVLAVVGASLPEPADGGQVKLDVLVSARSGRHRSPLVKAHLCGSILPAGSFVPMGFRGHDLWISSPELTFLQLSAELDVVAAAYVGMALCSSFRIEELDVAGVVRRDRSDEPLTSTRRIASYLRRASGVRGVERARRALEYVRDGALSPPEAGIGLCAELPPRLGGFSLGEVSLNRPVRAYSGSTDRRDGAYVTRYPDVVITSEDGRGNVRMAGIDHDPTLTHGGELRRRMDLERGNQIAACRQIEHFTFTNAQTSDYGSFLASMDQVRLALGRRRTPRERTGEAARKVDLERRDVWERFVHGSFVL